MTPQRYQLVKQVFQDACQCDGDARVAVLEHACAEDVELRSEVESLLAHDQQNTTFLTSPALDSQKIWAAGDPSNGAPHRLPERIGQYRILNVLGEGGMGTVYLAEQDRPRRHVALKVIRPGFASPQMLRRFEYEAQLLGRLHHPGIAQIYEAGTADTGMGPQPFFAMELIKGATLSEYARTMKLSIRDRLDLLARICDAVHHAHQKGVIHRDLKPGNILVDEFGQPKVLDFGVARMIGAEAAGNTMQTSPGQIIGTLAYMSPEQVAGDPHDLDTRCDVYSLGAIYYQLICGQLPHQFDNKSIPECVRIIQDQEIKPLGVVDKSFRGDLATIVCKALEKERARRYQSAHGLATDTRRLLHDEPIAARPPTKLYLLRKFVRRNKAAVIVALTLLLGAIGTTWQLSRAATEMRAHDETIAAYKHLLTERLQEREGEDPIIPRAKDITELEQPAVFVEENLSRRPLDAADLRTLIGLNYMKLEGYNDQAEHHLRLALEDRHRELDEPDADIAESLHNFGRVLWYGGEFADAEQYYRQALAMRQALHGPVHKDIAMTLTHIAACRRDQSDYRDAEAIYLQVIDMRESLYDSLDPEVIASYNNLATSLEKEGRYAEALEHFLRVLEMTEQKQFAADDSRVIRAKRHAAACLIGLGEESLALGDETASNRSLVQAEPYLLEALQSAERSRGRENRDVARILYELARLRLLQGRPVETRQLAAEAQAIQEQILKVGHPDTTRTQALLDQISQSTD